MVLNCDILFVENAMDIEMGFEGAKFKFRVGGILHCGGKYLAVKMNNNNFFCLPGGHVEIGEDTQQAVLREMREELGFEVKIDRLVAVNENFFLAEDKKQLHELGFYYVVSAVNESDINKSDYQIDEHDKGKIVHLDFKWFSLDELKNIDFRPKFLVECLENKQTTIKITKE